MWQVRIRLAAWDRSGNRVWQNDVELVCMGCALEAWLRSEGLMKPQLTVEAAQYDGDMRDHMCKICGDMITPERSFKVDAEGPERKNS